MSIRTFTEPVRFKFLDSLRGVAALLVVLLHIYGLLGLSTSYSFPPYWDYILSKGYLGVQIFFVLSGFVIAYSIRNANFSLKFLAEFFVKRSIRLDPPYWIALFLTVGSIFIFRTFIRAGEIPYDGFQIFTNIFYLQTLLGIESINPVAWTLCIELQLYMFLVVILSLLFRIENIFRLPSDKPSNYFLIFFSLLLIVSLESNSSLFTDFSSGLLNTKTGHFLPYWYSFFIGCAVCWNMTGWISRNWLFAFFGLIALYGIYSMNSQIVTSQIWTTLFISIIIYTIHCFGNLSTFIISPIFQYLGKISFSLYLVHWLVASNCIQFLHKRVGTINGIKVLGIFLFSLIASIVFAHFFYLCVELPFMLLSKKYGKKLIPLQTNAA